MAELAALNIRINGDSSDLQADINAAKRQLSGFEASAKKASATSMRFGGSFGQLGGIFQRNSFAISNAANQVSDLSVQLAMGTSASRALSQQLPQMTAFMGPLASIAGVAAGILIGLGGSFLSAGEGASSFKDDLEKLHESTTSLKDELFLLQNGLDSIAQVAILREITSIQEEITANEEKLAGVIEERRSGYARTAKAIRATLDADRDRLAVLQSQLEENKGLTKEIEAAKVAAKELSALKFDNIKDAAGYAANLADALNLSQTYMERMVQSGVASGAIPGQALDDLPATDAEKALQNALSKKRGKARAGSKPQGGKVAAANPLESQLELLRNGLMTEEELEMQSHARRQEMLRAALDQRLIMQKEYDGLMEGANQQHQDRMSQIDALRYGTGLQRTEAFMSELSGLMTSGNKKLFEIGKAAALANALVAAPSAAIAAWDKGMAAGGPPVAAAYAALSVAKTSSLISGIKGASFSGGGSAGGGGGAVSAAAAAPQASRDVTVQLVGGDNARYSRDDLIAINQGLNELNEDGGLISGIRFV